MEIDVLSHLNSPCLVRYHEHFTAKNYLCIVMEYCDGGDLSQKVQIHTYARCVFHTTTIAQDGDSTPS